MSIPIHPTMRWTTQVPSVCGFFWVDCVGITSGQSFQQVAVLSAAREGSPPSNIYLEGENYHVSRPPSHVQRWGDRPIEMPQS